MLVAFTLYNVSRYILYRKFIHVLFLKVLQEAKGDSAFRLEDEKNVFIIFSNLSCESVVKEITSKNFFDEIQKIIQRKNRKISLNFLFIGRLTEEEKSEFFGRVKGKVNIFIDKKEKSWKILYGKFNTVITPFLLITDKRGRFIYGTPVIPDREKCRTYFKCFVMKLREVL